MPISGKTGAYDYPMQTWRSTVGLVGWDTPGLKPKMAVAVGDRVKLGQTLFIDKRNPAGLLYGAGRRRGICDQSR